MEKTLPDFIADELIARIYIGDLKAGDRLPAERQLAEQLGVDRTSLRMALRTLNRMNLIRSVRGSGITVMDFRKQAGLDFLAAILDIPELELGSDIKLESVDAFNSIMSGLIHQQVSGPLDAAWVTRIRDLLLYQLELLDNEPWSEVLSRRLAELDMQLQDILLYQRGGLLVELMANSSRPLRSAMLRELFAVIDVRGYLNFHLDLIMQIGTGALPVGEVGATYLRYAIQSTEPLKQHYRDHPQSPHLRASPLQAGLQRQADS